MGELLNYNLNKFYEVMMITGSGTPDDTENRNQEEAVAKAKFSFEQSELQKRIFRDAILKILKETSYNRYTRGDSNTEEKDHLFISKNSANNEDRWKIEKTESRGDESTLTSFVASKDPRGNKHGKKFEANLTNEGLEFTGDPKTTAKFARKFVDNLKGSDDTGSKLKGLSIELEAPTKDAMKEYLITLFAYDFPKDLPITISYKNGDVTETKKFTKDDAGDLFREVNEKAGARKTEIDSEREQKRQSRQRPT